MASFGLEREIFPLNMLLQSDQGRCSMSRFSLLSDLGNLIVVKKVSIYPYIGGEVLLILRVKCNRLEN